MAHDVDGYQLAFTGRRTWRAEWRKGAKVLGEIQVTGHDDRVDRGQHLIAVWYQKKYWEEMEKHLADRRPFVIAQSEQEGRTFKRFRGIYEVEATDTCLSKWGSEAKGIEARILRRIIGSTEPKSAASELGQKGGKARAEKMTPAQRADAARKAAAKRWRQIAN
jgi:hypothetical protein